VIVLPCPSWTRSACAAWLGSSSATTSDLILASALLERRWRPYDDPPVDDCRCCTSSTPAQGRPSYGQGGFDRVVALTTLTALLPLLIVVALVVKMHPRGQGP